MSIKASDLKIGDTVCFKSDLVQYGIITKFIRNSWGGKTEIAVRSVGECFEGDYIGGCETTVLSLDQIWIEED